MENKRIWILLGLITAVIFGSTVFFISIICAPEMAAVQAKMIGLVAVLFMAFILVTVHMIFQRQKNEKKLIAASRQYVDLIANIQGGVITCVFNPKMMSSKTLYISEGWTELTGYTLEELNDWLGGNPQALVLPEDKETANKDYLEQTAQGNNYKLEYRIVRKDGSIIWTIDRGIVTIDENGNVQNQSIITEVTEIKEKEERLWKLAQMDPLTGLYNKTATVSLSEDVLKMHEDGFHALMVLDIDNFKGVNDSLGHIFGDAVLIEVSARLKRLFRNQDVIGRIGGDEFLILMVGVLSKEAAAKKAEEVCATFRNTYIGESGNYKISCSIGIAFAGEGQSYRELFNKADIALYEAKIKGKDQYVIYSGAEAIRGTGEGRIVGENKPIEKDSGELEIKERFFELLYGSVDFGGSINMALALLGRIMDAGSVYVFENSADNRLSSNTYEWCAGDTQSVIKKFQAIKIGEIGYLDAFDENGVFICQDLQILKPEIAALWQPRQAHSLMQVAIKENGVICGFIGCDNFRNETNPVKECFDVMIFAAKVMGIFILKKRAEEKVALCNRSDLLV